VNENHVIVAKRFDVFRGYISKNFVVKNSFGKDNVCQK
jgi:hypothetical protein